MAEMRAGVDDVLVYYRADLAFHRAVFAASGNPFVDRLGAIVSAVLEVSFRLQRRSLIPATLGLPMHERVLDAIRARDADAAESAMHDIIEEARIELEQAMRRAGMKVTRLETIRLLEFPNILWVRVHCEDGLYGLGETFMAAASVEAFLHEIVAPRILGLDALAIDLIASRLYGYLGFRSSGVETRAASAVDIALWDLWGKATGQPIVQLLGGRTREGIRTYNTCAGYQYIRDTRLQRVENWGLGQAPAGPYEDLDAFLHRGDELALSLLEQGITGMKIWPFDPAAEASGGHYISAPELDRALEPFRKIRSAVGDRMDIMVEFHSLWNLPTAIRIARALEPFDTFWHEDPIKMDALADLATYAAVSRAPVCASETLAFRQSFRELMEARATGIVMLDLSWCGGLSEAKKIATMAEAYHLPIAPHDCTGPVVLAASTHLSCNAPNALIQESVRAYYTGWYRELVTALPEVKDGIIAPPPGPGLGLDLLPGVASRKDAIVRASAPD